MIQNTVKIGDVIDISSGGTPNRKRVEYFEGGDTPWIRTGDLKGKYVSTPQEHITREALENSSAKIFPANTVLLAMYGATIGACSILPFPAATNQACGALLPSDKYYPLFLFYYLKSIKPQLIRRGVGGAQPNISARIIKDTNFPLLPLEEQKKIAAILDAADELRQKDKALIAKYDELTQSLFLDMFGDPVTNPKKWKSVKLESVCGKITDGTHKTPIYKDSGVIFLSAKNIKKYELNCDSPKYISKEEHALLSKRCNVEKDDILITKSGSLGMAAMVGFDFEFSIFESLALLKYIRESIDGKFLLYYLNTPSTQYKYAGITKGVGVKHLHLSDLRRLDIILPSRAIQKHFTERIQSIESQKTLAQESLDKSEALFNSLLQKAFKGELTN